MPLFCFLLLIVTIIVYEKAFFAHFQGDDFVVLEQHNISHLFSHIKNWFLVKDESFYRPLARVLFALNYLFWETNPVAYHITNILLHYLNSLIILFIAGRLTKNRTVGFWVALLFAVHPVHVEAVAWVSSLPDVLCTFFFLASIACYIVYRMQPEQWRKGFYVLSLLSFMGALCSKEMAITLPFVLILISIFYLPKPKKFSSPTISELANSCKIYIPFFILLSIYLVGYLKGGIGGYSNAKGESVHLQFSMITFDYLIDKLNRLTIPISSFKPYHSLIFLLFLLLLTVFMKKSCQFGLAWIFITLLPIANLYIEGGREHYSLAERYLYLPSVGFCWLFIPLIKKFHEKERGFSWVKRVAAGGLVLGACMYYMNSTRFEVDIWRTASNIAKNIPLEVKEMHPEITKTHFYFENLPDNLHGAYVYRLGLQASMKLVYSEEQDKGNRVYSHQIDDCKKIKRSEELGETAFCFRYENGHVKDITEETIFALDLRSHNLDKQEYLIEDVIDFRMTSFEKFLYRGWSAPDEWGRWGNKKESVVIFALPEKRSYEMTMRIRPVPLKGRKQIVQVHLNDTLIKQVTFSNSEWTLMSLLLPETALNGNVEMLRFLPKYVVSSASIEVEYIKISQVGNNSGS